MNRLSSKKIHVILILCGGGGMHVLVMLQWIPEKGVGDPGAEMKGM